MIHHFPTYEEIRKVAHVVGANRAAVESFLDGLDSSMPQEFHLRNLEEDAEQYGWKGVTVEAIRAGIKLAYSVRK